MSFLNRAAGFSGLPEECGIDDCPDTEFYRASAYRHLGRQNGISWSIWLRTNASTYTGPSYSDNPTYTGCLPSQYIPAIKPSYLRKDGAQDFTLEFRTSEPPYDAMPSTSPAACVASSSMAA